MVRDSAGGTERVMATVNSGGTGQLPLRQVDASTVTRVVQEKHAQQSPVRLRLPQPSEPERDNRQRVEAPRLDTYA